MIVESACWCAGHIVGLVAGQMIKTGSSKPSDATSEWKNKMNSPLEYIGRGRAMLCRGWQILPDLNFVNIKEQDGNLHKCL